MNKIEYWSLDCDILGGPKDSAVKIATAQMPEIAKDIAEAMNAMAELAAARASVSTYREQYEASEMNIKNLMHYAKGRPGHVSISSPAIPIRDELILLHADKADIENKWEELCKAIGAHGPESDPLTGSDTNDIIHQRAMERIREITNQLDK